MTLHPPSLGAWVWLLWACGALAALAALGWAVRAACAWWRRRRPYASARYVEDSPAMRATRARLTARRRATTRRPA